MAKRVFDTKIGAVDDRAAQQTRAFANTESGTSLGDAIKTGSKFVLEPAVKLFDEIGGNTARDSASAAFEQVMQDTLGDVNKRSRGTRGHALAMLAEKRKQIALHPGRRDEIEEALFNLTGQRSSLKSAIEGQESAEASAANRAAIKKVADFEEAKQTFGVVKNQDGYDNVDKTIERARVAVEAGGIAEGVNSKGKSLSGGSRGVVRDTMFQTLTDGRPSAEALFHAGAAKSMRALVNADPTDSQTYLNTLRVAITDAQNFKSNLRSRYEGINDAEFDFLTLGVRDEYDALLEAAGMTDADLNSPAALKKVAEAAADWVKIDNALLQKEVNSMPYGRAAQRAKKALGEKGVQHLIAGAKDFFSKVTSSLANADKNSKLIWKEAAKTTNDIFDEVEGGDISEVVVGEASVDEGLVGKNLAEAALKEGAGKITEEQGDTWLASITRFLSSVLSFSSDGNLEESYKGFQSHAAQQTLVKQWEKHPQQANSVLKEYRDMATTLLIKKSKELRQLEVESESVTIINEGGRLKVDDSKSGLFAYRPDLERSGPRAVARRLVKEINDAGTPLVNVRTITDDKDLSTEEATTKYGWGFYQRMSEGITARAPFLQLPDTVEGFVKRFTFENIFQRPTKSFELRIPGRDAETTRGVELDDEVLVEEEGTPTRLTRFVQDLSRTGLGREGDSGLGNVPSNGSGVTVFNGLDLGQNGAKELKALGASDELITALTPLFGKKGDAAEIALGANPIPEGLATELKKISTARIEMSLDIAEKSVKGFNKLPEPVQFVWGRIIHQWTDSVKKAKGIFKTLIPLIETFANEQTDVNLLKVIQELRNEKRYTPAQAAQADELQAFLREKLLGGSGDDVLTGASADDLEKFFAFGDKLTPEEIEAKAALGGKIIKEGFNPRGDGEVPGTIDQNVIPKLIKPKKEEEASISNNTLAGGVGDDILNLFEQAGDILAGIVPPRSREKREADRAQRAKDRGPQLTREQREQRDKELIELLSRVDRERIEIMNRKRP
tara:strand:+ start:54 stop:3092 length:3039 start_codon:yes stop_codon:yes gene_type:complete